MDPVCHTLAGAAMAATGLHRRTRLAAATLIVGANLPDVDVLAYLGGPLADLEFRRGWTHGILALVVLPFLLTGAMLLFDRASRWLRRAALPSDVRPREILLLSAIAILSHPILDTLNTYGVRWLMPFSERWFYGDTLFIVDPWLWLALGLGLVLSRRRERSLKFRIDTGAPARVALTVAAGYILVMALVGLGARRVIARELGLPGGASRATLMASPVPVNPFVRRFVVARGDSYVVGNFRWLRNPHVDPSSLMTYPRGRPNHPAVDAAASTVAGRRFLGWARFPTFQIDSSGAGYVVHMIDVRYAERAGVRFGAVSIAVGG